MDWKEKMRLGIELIHEACEDDMQDKMCYECPFDKICDVIVKAYDADASRFRTPNTWNV